MIAWRVLVRTFARSLLEAREFEGREKRIRGTEMEIPVNELRVSRRREREQQEKGKRAGAQEEMKSPEY